MIMQGVQTLRDRIAAKVLALYGADYDPVTEITVTSGATEALFAAISAVVRNDDHRVLRFCFAKKDKTLQKAAQKLCRI